ncbi:MAG: agmatinase [Synergistaceae bacterium]|jgi:agmatinase|nr:agmatinase [Synergistaceae bacterium]
MPSKLEAGVRTFAGCGAPYDESEVVLFGAPFDSTTSYRPGARFASSSIRSESIGIETYSPYQMEDIENLKISDAGDLELPFGNAGRALDVVETFCGKVLDDGKMPVMIGGEHLLTFGAVRAVAARHPDLRLIHFDAHADLRRDYMGESLSHATVMRRVWDLLGDGRIYQFGIRSGTREEFDWATAHVRTELFTVRGIDGCSEAVSGYPVYISVDLDVIDPSEFPGTGTPEAGGVSFKDLLDALLCLKGLNVAGFDICELAPHYDVSGISTALACKVLREMLIAYY